MPRWTHDEARFEMYYWIILVISLLGTWHSWQAGEKYNGVETRSVKLVDAWSYLSGNKQSVSEHWTGEFVDRDTGRRFELELTPQFYNQFVRGERRPIDTTHEFALGRFNSNLDSWRSVFVFYRFVATTIFVLCCLRPVGRWMNNCDNLF